MARQDPTLITFRLPRDVVRDIASRADCPPSAGPGHVGGVSLWVRQLVLREMGLDADSDTAQARQKAIDEYLLVIASYWRIRKVITDLQAESDKKSRPWISKMTRAEKQLTLIENELEGYPQAPGHELGCDCDECQQAASVASIKT